MSNRQQHRVHGDPDRFDVLAQYVSDTYGKSVTYIADVAGGQGLLSRILNKKHHYSSEVVDPRGWVLKGVPSRQEEFKPELAFYYDLIIGLHPDEATRQVAEAALHRPAIVIPCCNFWSEEKMGQFELIAAIEDYYTAHGIRFDRVEFGFKGPKNIGLVSEPPSSK